MSQFSVRRARTDDWETIAEFNCRLAEESENKQLSRERIEPGVRAVLADDSKGRYFLACDGERIIGQLMHTFEWSDWRNGMIWWLQSVYVVPEFRRRGVFRRLYDFLRESAESDPGVVGLRLYIEDGNERALQTYLRSGMKQAGYFVMERLFIDVSNVPD